MHRNLTASLALLLALPAAACVDRGGTTDPQDVSTQIEAENGGFDTADEPPMFAAEADFDAAAIEGDAIVTDALAADPATAEMDRASNATGLKVTVLWGKLPAERGAQDSRTWTGTLKVSRGGMIVLRTVGFEDETDHLLPRTARDTVAFESVTRPYVDGLALNILDPAVTPSPTAALTLTYTPRDGGTSYTLDLGQLANGPIVVDAGDGFKIVAIAHRRHPDPCDRGFMRGRWHALSPHLGRFLGIVTNEDGERVGHVRGIFGQRRNGEAVLFGKFINREGHFRGILSGTFGDGAYRARWVDRGGDHGIAVGRYFEGASERAGGFLGRWAETSCDANITPAPSPAPTNEPAG